MTTTRVGCGASEAPVGYSRGSIYAGAAEVRYFRAGRGSPVVVLGESGPMQTRVCRALESRFLVIVPALETGAAEGSIGDLLRQILDGLGLGTAHLVADAVYGVKALGFVLGDIDRVDRLAILCRSSSAPGSYEVALADTLRDTGHALMVLQMEGAESAGSDASLQLDALLSFLDPGSGERGCG